MKWKTADGLRAELEGESTRAHIWKYPKPSSTCSRCREPKPVAGIQVASSCRRAALLLQQQHKCQLIACSESMLLPKSSFNPLQQCLNCLSHQIATRDATRHASQKSCPGQKCHYFFVKSATVSLSRTLLQPSSFFLLLTFLLIFQGILPQSLRGY